MCKWAWMDTGTEYSPFLFCWWKHAFFFLAVLLEQWAAILQYPASYPNRKNILQVAFPEAGLDISPNSKERKGGTVLGSASYAGSNKLMYFDSTYKVNWWKRNLEQLLAILWAVLRTTVQHMWLNTDQIHPPPLFAWNSNWFSCCYFSFNLSSLCFFKFFFSHFPFVSVFSNPYWRHLLSRFSLICLELVPVVEKMPVDKNDWVTSLLSAHWELRLTCGVAKPWPSWTNQENHNKRANANVRT